MYKLSVFAMGSYRRCREWDREHPIRHADCSHSLQLPSQGSAYHIDLILNTSGHPSCPRHAYPTTSGGSILTSLRHTYYKFTHLSSFQYRKQSSIQYVIMLKNIVPRSSSRAL